MPFASRALVLVIPNPPRAQAAGPNARPSPRQRGTRLHWRGLAHVRPLWLLAAGMLASLSLAAGPAAAQDARVLRMSTFVPDAPTVLARANGGLGAAGISMDVTITSSSTEQMQGLSDGTYDIASTAFDNVLAWSGRAGADIIAVAQTDGSVELPIVARPEIHDWADLRGKPLAVDAADTAFALVLRRVLEAHDLQLDRDYTFVAIGAPVPRLQAMEHGTAYAAILNPPTDAQAIAEGMVLLGDQRQVLPDYPGGVLAVRRDWAQANRQELVAFLRAWSLAGQLAAADPQTAAEAFAEAADLPPTAARRLLPTDFNAGALQVAGLQTVLDLRNRYAYQLPMGPELSVYYDPSYYDEAVATAGK
jgi:ABC-type nitrate/sulfonate/bicarbonate transport system substrate-binding protein